MMSKLIVADIKSVSKCFSKVIAVDAINAQIEAGKLTGLVGPDGAGKTTLMRMLANLMQPSSGSISIKSTNEHDDISEFVGYMPQRFGLYEDLSVMENMCLYAQLRGIDTKHQEALFAELLAFTKLEPFVQRLAGKLSGGMKQKLGLACALMARPKLLLLDEPGVGVDPVSRQDLWAMVQALTDDGMAVVWATAYMDEAQQCESVLLMDKGKFLYQGTPQTLMAQYKTSRFEDAFIELLGGFSMTHSEIADRMPEIKLPHLQVENQSNGDPRATMVECTHLTKRFGDFSATDNVSFSVKQGEIFGLLGPNGAGKSTTFKMLCGLLSVTEGNAKVVGLELAHAGKQAKLHLGYMAQKFSLYNLLSIKQNLNFSAGVYGLKGKEKKARINEMIETFHLQPFLDSSPDSLSLGYKQRLALACALMHRPAVLFLDEPTSGVDPLTRREFWMHIKAFAAKGMTIMVTTHFMDEAEYCDRIALMYRSQLIALDTPEKLKQSVAEKGQTIDMEEAFITLIKRNEANRKKQEATQ
jgi:ABC-2 type transport system ATP-binding protein